MPEEDEWVLDDGVPTTIAPQSHRAHAILAGFKINWMSMCDAETGSKYWQEEEWGDLMAEREIHIPASILRCRAVAREFQFSSVESMDDLRIEQRIFFQENCMEEWRFHFGFVIPNSTNTWQQTIEAPGSQGRELICAIGSRLPRRRDGCPTSAGPGVPGLPLFR
mmetsp:Transcript_32517/g.97084  ORF Transcript_32517/g.97084 Transcript_32517/m.97084 type:complete len:165 (+) Transcript_32517:60-554(+)